MQMFGTSKNNRMKEINHIPSMTPEVVLSYLNKLGFNWSSSGVAVELGSWLGATAAPLLKGLTQAGYNERFWAFDKWSASEVEVRKAKEQGVDLYVNQDLLPLFLNNVKPIYSKIYTVQGVMPGTVSKYRGKPIEICLFDALKLPKTFYPSMSYLLPYFIPGVTVIGLMDYYFYKKKEGQKRNDTMVAKRFIEKYPDNFEKIQEWNNVESVFFKYIKKIGGE